MGGTSVAFTGLTPTNDPLLIDPPPDVSSRRRPVARAGAAAGGGRAALRHAFYAVSEAAGAAPVVVVVRQRGSVGAVTATIATSDGTAVAGTDYRTVLTTVHFADGDDSPKLVTVPVIANDIDEPDRTVLLRCRNRAAAPRSAR